MVTTTGRPLSQRTLPWFFGSVLLGASWASACSSSGGDAPPTNVSSGVGGSAASSATSTTNASGSGGLILGGGGGSGGGTLTGPFKDFPAAPILDAPTGTAAPPQNSATLFGPAGSGDPSGGPCLVDPVPGTLFPKNWARPRFSWVPATGQNLFELRIHASANETNDLVVYTTASQWTMPREIWTPLTRHLPDVPLTVTIRGATLSGTALSGNPAMGTSGDIQIAPAAAAGSIVYWRTVNAANTGELKGFSPGDESVVLALDAAEVAVKPGGATVTCFGCHTSTPDGKFAAMKTLDGTRGGVLASVEQATAGQAPNYWSAASITAMNDDNFGIPSFSNAHWADGDRVLLTSWGNSASAELAWFDLEATATGQGKAFDVLKRDGDSRGAIMPSFSHDGTRIVYTSTSSSIDGRPNAGDTDLYAVPYASRAGGAATPVSGAADPALSEYYPAFSPDDAFIAFNRINQGEGPYDQPDAEIFVIPSTGGSATRLAANDPIACSGQTSPGLTNSWPKWAPQAVIVGDRTFYWLAFSSKRSGGSPQLYMTAMVKQGGTIKTYPALYIWAQPADEANHTPAWDMFQIPPPPPPH